MPKFKCENCSKEIFKLPSEVKKVKHGRFFCCKSCSATYNNKIFPKRKSSKKCTICNSQVYGNKKYCSIKCRQQGLKLNKKPKLSSDQKRIRDTKKTAAYRKRMKEKAIQYKGGKCEICGYNKCHRSLCFHHLDPSKKDFGISGLTLKWEKQKTELDKCILVCSNCHGELHDELITYP